jgi:hypothetical protein
VQPTTLLARRDRGRRVACEELDVDGVALDRREHAGCTALDELGA